MIKQLVLTTALALAFSIAPLAAEEKLVVGGSGAMGDAVEALVKAYKDKHPGEALHHIPENMSTTGGIEGAKTGRLTVGIITRPVNDKEKSEGLVYRPVTRIPVVVGVNKSATVSGLSEAQVCDIFSGRVKSWREVGGGEGKIMVLGRKRDDNSMNSFREKMACFRNIELSSDAILLVQGGEVLDSLNNRPGTVGITVAGSALMTRPNIRSIVLAGVAPTLEAVKSAKYKYFNEVGFVTVGEPRGAIKRFVDFVASAEAEKILEKFGMAAVR